MSEMNNWQKLFDSIQVPKDMTLHEWVALEGPNSDRKRAEERLQNLHLSHEIFLAKYQITELGSSQVALTLPAGISRIDFFKDAQTLSIALRASGLEKFSAGQAIRPEGLEKWESESRFKDITERALSLRVDGNVKGSSKKTRLEQEANGWNDVTLENLAVAHTAFYLLTGKDLFEGQVVRAAGGALRFDSGGLHVNIMFRDGFSLDCISASCSLPNPN